MVTKDHDSHYPSNSQFFIFNIWPSFSRSKVNKSQIFKIVWFEKFIFYFVVYNTLIIFHIKPNSPKSIFDLIFQGQRSIKSNFHNFLIWKIHFNFIVYNILIIFLYQTKFSKINIWQSLDLDFQGQWNSIFTIFWF